MPKEKMRVCCIKKNELWNHKTSSCNYLGSITIPKPNWTLSFAVKLPEEQSVVCFRFQNDFTTITFFFLVTAGGAMLPSHTHGCPCPCLRCLLAAADLAEGKACPKGREVVKGRLQVPQALSSWPLNNEQHLCLFNGRGNFFIPKQSSQYPE